MPSGLTTSAKSYWAESRSHRHSLLFALPLLVIYEALEAIAPVRSGGSVVRNGADVVLTGAFTAMLGARGPLVFMGLVIGIALILVWRDRGPLHARTFVLMFFEACLLALVFGAAVGVATMRLVGPLRSLVAGGPLDGPVLTRLTLSLGAGLYEELLFRVLLVAFLANAFRVIGLGRVVGGAIAVALGALVFSAFHYIGPFGEALKLESFVFRTLAGVAFSALYLTRGFGMTAWTHALYDVAVLL